MIKEKDEIKQLEYDTIFKATFIRRQEVLIKMIRDVFEIEDDINNPLFIVGYELVPHSKRGKSYKSDILIKLSVPICGLVKYKICSGAPNLTNSSNTVLQ